MSSGQLTSTVWALGEHVYGVPGSRGPTRLAGIVHAPFVGTLGPAAVPDRDPPRFIAYNSFQAGRPLLRVHDLQTHDDQVVDEGAFSVAWRSDGALAYFKGSEAAVEDPRQHVGHVYVRSSPATPAVRWTSTPDRYVVAAWARGQLVVHRIRDGWTEVLALHAPGDARSLASRAALVALSPDGTEAFMTEQATGSPRVRVTNVASGAEAASLTLPGNGVDAATGRSITYVAHSGAWQRDIVIAAVSGGVAVFRVRPGQVILEQLMWLDPEAFPTGLSELRSDASGRTFAALTELAQRPHAALPETALLECHRIQKRCVLGSSQPYSPGPRILYNPSRP